jgi:hypothetical protein
MGTIFLVGVLSIGPGTAAFICRHAVPAVLPGGRVPSVRPWFAAPHMVDPAAGPDTDNRTDTDNHDSDVGLDGPPVAPPGPGSWLPQRPEVSGLTCQRTGGRRAA